MSGLFLPPSSSDVPGWIRKAATAVNHLLRNRSFPFDRMSAAPDAPEAGQAYYDTTTNKARVYDGSGWIDLW